MEAAKTIMITLIFLLMMALVILALIQQESHNWLMFGAGVGASFAVFGLIAVIFGKDEPIGKASPEEDKPQSNTSTADEVLDRFASSEDDPRSNGPRPNR